MGKPKFKSVKVENNLSEIDEIFKKYKKNLQSDDEQGIIDSENAYMEWSSQSIEIIQEVKDNEKQILLLSRLR